MKQKYKISKNRFSAGFRRKGDKESFKLLLKNNNYKDQRNSIAYKQKYTPISILFKNDPISFQLILTLIKFNEINKDNNISNYIDNHNEEKQEKDLKDLINKIIKLIKSHRGLYNFISYYKIDDKLLFKIIPELQFQQREKNYIIWEENDNSTQVNFLLKGKISFSKKNNSSVEEKYIQNENIFGMLDVIYERKRKLSCICATECCYLSIEKEFFKKNIEEKVSRIELEKKSFLIKFFNKYLIIPLIKLERFIMKYVEILFFRKNDIIYKKGDTNKSLYLIFNGEANLMTNINEGEFFVLSNSNQSINRLQEMARNIDYINIIKNENNAENNKVNNNNKIEYLDFLLEKANYEVISTLSKGCVGGLEITTGMTKFKYTLISNTNFCAILKLNIEHLEDEHLKMLLINLLPDFIKSEKKIHHQIKNIKYIDNNIIPPSCQKYKDMSNLINNNVELKSQNIHKSKNYNKNYISLNITDNEDNKTYDKIIQKIDDRFDKNEGGFIKMNNFNINLCKKKYYLKEKIKNSKRNDITIINFIKKYKEENLNNLKNSSFKMNYLLNEKTIKSANLYESILSKKYNNNQKSFKNSYSKSELKTWNFPRSPKSKLSTNKNLFNMNMNFSKKEKKNNRAQSSKITKKQYINKLNEIFENYYKKKYLQKDYSKGDDNEDHKLVSIQLIMNSFKKNKNINLLKKKNNFIKEIVYMKEPLSKLEKINTNTLTYDSSDRINNTETINTLTTYYRENKNLSKFNTINEFNFNENKFENNKNSERVIKIVNNKYLRDLFYINSNKIKNRRKLLFNKIKDKKNIKHRMIFYDTGHFDMPLATNLPKFE